MKCPICGQQLRPGKKDPNYLLCYDCKKKFKAPQVKTAEKREEKEQKYSNIPPKHVREKRENEMKKAYDEMLAVENDRRSKKKKSSKPQKREEYDYDGYDDVYEEDEKMSKAPVVILGIAIVVVAAVIAYMMFFK